MEERIRAIMKMKKTSLAAVITAALLVVGVTAVFATSKAPEPKKIDDLPPAVMTNTDPKPSASASAPVEKDKPTTIDRVHPVTGTPDQSAPEQGTDQNPIQGSSWNIPDGPIAAGTKIFAGDEQSKNDLVKHLRKDMGYGGPIAFEHIGDANGGGGTWSVILQEDYDGVRRVLEVPKGLTADWTYPVNSKGETYGSAMSEFTVGYLPDLIGVVTSDGVSGYMTSVGYCSHGYSYSISNPDEAEAYMNWLKAQPSIIKIPVYDVEHNTVLGYYEMENTASSDYVISPERADEILHDVEYGLSNNTDMTDQEVAQAILQYKAEQIWKVPAGEIPRFTEFTVADFDDAAELGKYLEATHGLYPNDYVNGKIGTRYVVQVTYWEREIRERLPDGTYPVNSKGETYGTVMDDMVVGYAPDLVSVKATIGEDGYVINRDRRYRGYPGEINNPDDANAYMEWLKTQPYVIPLPVYDVDRTKVVGYYITHNEESYEYNPSQEDIELELKTVEDQMRRNMGLSEEEIAKELEALKQSRGWS